MTVSAAHGDPGNEAMREASGHVTNSDRLALFLYLLARDTVPVGKLEDIIVGANLDAPVKPMGEILYTNGWLAQWAEYTAARLVK